MPGGLLQVGTPHELLTRPADEFVASLMATPRRQADQLEALASQPRRRRHVMSPQLAELLHKLPIYLGGHLTLVAHRLGGRRC